MITSRLSLLICFAVLFFSCKKEESGSQGSRLKMIRSQDGDSIGYVSFKYDNKDRLNILIDSNNNGNISTTNITYDAEGKLSKVTNNGTIYTFEYDDKGRITKRFVLYPGRQTSTVENAYSYDVNGRVIADSIFSYWSGNLFEILTYSYDQNNNVTESEVIDKGSGMLSRRYQYSYDNHSNPLNSVSILRYILNSGEEILSLGKNNLVAIKDSDGNTISYTYEYNSTGLPQKSSWQDNTDPMIVRVDYYYE
jgi:YD repeat-containing protein